MFRPAVRALARAPAVAARTPASTRLISTGPTPKSRSFKNTLVRLGLAGGAIYYYNTNSAFSEEPSCMCSHGTVLDPVLIFPGLRTRGPGPGISEFVASGANGIREHLLTMNIKSSLHPCPPAKR